MWNHDIILIAETVVGEDELKQAITEVTETRLLCKKQRVSRSEFYQASQTGLRPSLVVDVRAFEYEGQKKAVFEGAKYRIIKTYPLDREILELTLTEEL